jgi:aspartate beta-hydroxylase
MSNEPEDRVQFTCALMERLLAAGGLDVDGVRLLEAGMRSGRRQARKPPDPWQQPLRHYPGLAARPWHDPAEFEWVARLEAAFPEIRAEALAMHDAGRFAVNELSGGLAEGSWLELRLSSEGRRNAEHCAACPRTVEVVESIPGATSAGLVYFAAVGPGARVRPHWGPHNARLRCHLGLVVPGSCEMRVGPETRTWDEGRVLIFDDSYEHELWNRSDSTRIVLLLDVWHPDLTAAERYAIRASQQPIVEMAYEIAAGWARDGAVPRLNPAPAPDRAGTVAP